MVVDASAIMAILQSEPEAKRFSALIAARPVCLVSPVNLLEVHMLSRTRRGDSAVLEAELFIASAGLDVAPVTAIQLAAARDAFDRFGKGRHPAGLNLADCFAYALSRTSGEPLLFKGGDFAKTDVMVAG